MAGQKGIVSLKKKDQVLLKRFGKIIHTERQKRNWTLEDTEANGYPNGQHWQAVESGFKNISFTTILNICRTLELQPNELFKELHLKLKGSRTS